MDQISADFSGLSADFSKTTTELQGRIGKIDERFGQYLDVLEGGEADLGARLEDVERRVTRLEEGGSPAA